MSTVPLSLMAKSKKVGGLMAKAAKPVTDSMVVNENLLSKRIEAIEQFGYLQYLLNLYATTKDEEDEDAEQAIHEMKLAYCRYRSFFSRKIGRLLSQYIELVESDQPATADQVRKVVEALDFELRCSISPLPSHAWQRIVHYRLVPLVVVAAVVALYFVLTKEFGL